MTKFFQSIINNKQLVTYQWLVIVSLLSAFILTPLMSFLGRKFRILDIPNERKVHKDPTPLLGGLAIYIAFATSVVLNFHFSKEMKGVAIGGTLVLLMGLVDDFRKLPATVKLLGQLLSVSIVMLYGVRMSFLPNNLWGDIGEVILTIIWVVGITNALNFIDGMDGLATGCAAIQALFLSIVALQTGQKFLGYLSLALLGSCIGFLPYNFKLRRSASIFLGDAGSTFLGFSLASLAVMSDWAEHEPIKAFSAPVLIMGILIYDMIHTTISRIATKKVSSIKEWLDYTGKDHLHHRLNSLGLSKKQTVLFIYLINICLGIGAIVLRVARPLDAVILVFQAVVIMVIIATLELLGSKKVRSKEAKG